MVPKSNQSKLFYMRSIKCNSGINPIQFGWKHLADSGEKQNASEGIRSNATSTGELASL